MGIATGADTIDLVWVQVHSTGLVKQDDHPDAKIKFLRVVNFFEVSRE